MILAGVVHRRTGIEATEPRVSWTIPEQTEIGSIPWQRASYRERGRQKLARQINSRGAGTNHQVKLVQVGPVDRKGQAAPIGTAKNRRVQNIDQFVIDSIQVHAGDIESGIDNERDWAKFARN